MRARRAAAYLAAVIVLGLAAGAFVWNATRTPGSRAEHAAAAVPGGRIAAGDAELERLLARAQRALNAGELTTPPGASAADLYREALRRSARDPRAIGGLEQVIEQLLTGAEAQLQQGQIDPAQELVSAAYAIDPAHPRVAFVIAEVAARRERALPGKAQRAGNVRDQAREVPAVAAPAPATATPDAPTTTSSPATPVPGVATATSEPATQTPALATEAATAATVPGPAATADKGQP
ncbi:MAG: hypothetical protein JO173_01435 [Gammaproteobacteria bacterium]|nr:hypothetical protein [Gammaproteobacteria bacterium]